jgi:hypothetical protein
MGCLLLGGFALLTALTIFAGAVSVFATSPAINGAGTLFFGFNILYSLAILLLLLFGRGEGSRRWAGGLAMAYALYMLSGSMDGGRISPLEMWAVFTAAFVAWIHYLAVSCLVKRRENPKGDILKEERMVE